MTDILRYIFIAFLITSNPVLLSAQQLLQVSVQDTNSLPVPNVKVLVNNEIEVETNQEGIAPINFTNSSSDFLRVKAIKEGFRLSTWGVLGDKLKIIVQPVRFKIVKGKVNIIGSSASVAIKDSSEIFLLSGDYAGTSTIDKLGKFQMRLPKEAKISRKSRFVSKQFTFTVDSFAFDGRYHYWLNARPNIIQEEKAGWEYFKAKVVDEQGAPVPELKVTISGINYVTDKKGSLRGVWQNGFGQVSFSNGELVKLLTDVKKKELLAVVIPDTTLSTTGGVSQGNTLSSPSIAIPSTVLVADSIKMVSQLKEVNEAIRKKLENPPIPVEFFENILDSLKQQFEEEGLADATSLTKEAIEAEIDNLEDVAVEIKEIDPSADISDILERIESLRLELMEKDRRLEYQKQKQREFFKYLFAAFGVIIFFGGLSFLFFVLFTKSRKRKKQLEVQKEELDVKNSMLASMTEQLEQTVVDLEDTNEKITDSIRYAQTIQAAILPTNHIIADYLRDFFVLFRPKDIVSGDFYWFATKEVEGRTYAYVAAIDCTGHGVPGAFMSMIGNTVLHEIINKDLAFGTDEMLEILDHEIHEALHQEETENNDGMDLALCKVRIPKEGESEVLVDFTGAKRPLFLHRKDSEIEVIRGSRRSIGGVNRKKKKTFEVVNLQLKEGDVFYLTSDGLADQNSPDRKKFGQRRFMDIMQGLNGEAMSEQQKIFEKELDGFQKEAEQRDDITVIGVRI